MLALIVLFVIALAAGALGGIVGTGSLVNVTGGAPFVVSGLVQGDSVSELTQSFDSKNAGARLLQVNGYSISDGNEGGNYAVTLDTAQGTITPAPLTLAATSETKVYDGTTTATATPTVSGLVEGDSVSNLFEVFDNKNAGPRVLTVVGGGTNPNQGEGGPPTETHPRSSECSSHRNLLFIWSRLD